MFMSIVVELLKIYVMPTWLLVQESLSNRHFLIEVSVTNVNAVVLTFRYPIDDESTYMTYTV